MANEIKLITFADSEVTATDDAYVYESAIGEGGIINGCDVTIKNASELHINGGNGVLCGRKFTVYDSDLPVTLSSSGTLLGRLYIHMDLSNASTPIQLMIETGGSLTPVQQDADVNATNGIYEINLSTFNVDTSTISDLVDVAPKVYTHEVLNTLEECVASTNPGDIAGASVAATLNSKLGAFGEYVEVTKTTASETRAQMLMRLYSLIDQTKITPRACLVTDLSYTFNLTLAQPTFLNFGMVYGVSASDGSFIQISVASNSASWRMTSIKATTVTSNEYSTYASDPIGMNIRFYY